MYKLLLSLLVILCLSFSVNAQFSKGNLLVGGTLSYEGGSSTVSGSDLSNHGGNFNPSLGIAINENSVFGVSLGYSFSKSTSSTGPVSNKSNAYSIGVFYRKYKTLGKDFYLFGEAGAGYNNSNQSAKDNLGVDYSSSTGNGGYLILYPGIAYKISNKLFLEISIPSLINVQYSSSKTTNQNGYPPTITGDQFSISTSLSSGALDALGVGFRLIL